MDSSTLRHQQGERAFQRGRYGFISLTLHRSLYLVHLAATGVTQRLCLVSGFGGLVSTGVAQRLGLVPCLVPGLGKMLSTSVAQRCGLLSGFGNLVSTHVA